MRILIRYGLMALMLCRVPVLAVAADDTPRRWGVQAGFGEVNMMENNGVGSDGSYVSEDQGNLFFIHGDYYLSQRLALTGGLFLEQQGLFTYYADGIGLEKANLMGVEAGAKFYFFPKKWIVQPHVGASLLLNGLNLAHQRGKNSRLLLPEGYPGTQASLEYDVQCPLLSVAPRLGVDVRVFSSVSLCVDYDLRLGLGGRSQGTLKFLNGPMVGQTRVIDERNQRTGVSVGVKVDFPLRRVNENQRNNLINILYDLFAPSYVKFR